jgi:hypothetical protein
LHEVSEQHPFELKHIPLRAVVRHPADRFAANNPLSAKR